MTATERSRPLVVAHRGVHSGGLIENTFDAFNAAVAAGADMIEFDVRISGDGQLAILHDHKLKGVALDSCTLDEFEQRTGFRPPLLPDVLDWALGKIALDVELKENSYVDQLLPLLTGFQQAGGELIVTSFVEDVLTQLAQSAPSLKTGLLLGFTSQMAAQRTQAVQAKVALPEMKTVTEEVIASVTASGLELIVWDYMAQRDGPELISDPRVAAVITDDVAGALAARA